MEKSIKLKIGQRDSGGPAGILKGYKDSSSSTGGFGTISSNQYKASKIFAIEARLNSGNKAIEIIITPALSDKVLFLDINGHTMELNQYTVNKEIYETANVELYDFIMGEASGNIIDVTLSDMPFIAPAPPSKSVYPNLKGPVLIENTAKGKYCSLYSSNTKAEHLELDVSNVIGNTTVIKGSIMMYHDFKNTGIPLGWKMCNGQSGTPDLKYMFIEATNNKAEHNKAEQGSNTITTPEHKHTIKFTGVGKHLHNANPAAADTEKNAAHTHREEMDKIDNNSVGKAGCYATYSMGSHIDWMAFHRGKGGVRQTSKVGTHTHSLNPSAYNMNTAGSHQHTIKVGKTGTGTSKTQLNTPPYYALVYIIKT